MLFSYSKCQVVLVGNMNKGKIIRITDDESSQCSIVSSVCADVASVAWRQPHKSRFSPTGSPGILYFPDAASVNPHQVDCVVYSTGRTKLKSDDSLFVGHEMFVSIKSHSSCARFEPIYHRRTIIGRGIGSTEHSNRSSSCCFVSAGNVKTKVWIVIFSSDVSNSTIFIGTS